MKASDIKKLRDEELITPEQCERILARFAPDSTRTNKRVVASFSTLAALAIVGGIVMLVSANWASIPSLVKMIAGMLLLASCWAGFVWCRPRYPKTAEALALAGAGMWLADIALYAQIFQLQNPFVEGCFLFFCGIALLPFVIELRWSMLLVAVASCVLLGAMVATPSSESWLGVGGKGSWMTVTALASLFVFWWIFGERCLRATSFYRSYAYMGKVALIALTMLEMNALFMNAFSDGEMSLRFFVAVWGAAMLLALVLKPAGPWAAYLPFWALTAASLPLAFFWGLAETWPPLNEGPGIATYCFLYGLSATYFGAKALRTGYINVGALLIVCAVLALVADMLDSYSLSGWSLIGGGVLLLALALAAERQRRRAVRSIVASRSARDAVSSNS